MGKRQRKAQVHLERRLQDYKATVARRNAEHLSVEGFHQPGSLQGTGGLFGRTRRLNPVNIKHS